MAGRWVYAVAQCFKVTYLLREFVHYVRRNNLMSYRTTATTHPQHVVPRIAKANSRFSRNCPGLLASLGIAALLLGSAPALAQSLGNAQPFAILGFSAVNANGSGSIINGDVG